ncbi:MAG: 5-oxoprolinase, partial [Gammaproteobacteria bacterium]|nr:5-oxoprolinase [Gammaproteobacteria bacterium]
MSDWRFWIDRGGTFTDVVARTPDGRLKVHKLLSEDPSRYTDAAVHAIGVLMAEADAPGAVRDLKMGTTVATNALLERRGEPTLLLVNRGYADALLIGYQNRPDLFALEIQRPPALYADVLEAEGRIDADGRELAPLDTGALLEGLKAAQGRGLKSVAVCFMHAWR